MGIAPTKTFLWREYVKNKLSTWAIEKKFGIPRSAVYVALRRYGIQPRTLARSHLKYERSNFSGDIHEKSYLLGFAIGDLRIRRHNGSRSETISIGCGSTKSTQIRLIEELFSAYGRVWKGAPDRRGAVNIEAFVDNTFSFLLPDRRTYRWCSESRKTFFSFLAGFTDAEGSLYISNGKAFIAWGNYDEDILRFIQEGLKKFNIETPRICRDSLRGYKGSHGYLRRKNYYHLTCTRKEFLRTILVTLKPLIRHRDKMDMLEKALENIAMRDRTFSRSSR